MSKNQSPVVGIVMGSESDFPVMEGAVDVFKQFDVPFEIRVLSAHRTPAQTEEYASSAEERGIQVLIAAAGGAAHLAGVVAAFTPLPIIGVPIPSKHLGGFDSLLSMVQMPSGVPVACVAIGGAKNAALLAIQIMSVGDAALRERMRDYKAEMIGRVREMDTRVRAKATPV